MHSSIISKIEKARTYAGERGRVRITALNATFRGNHSQHALSYDGAGWHCSCSSFGSQAICSHIMAIQRMLDGMLALDESPSEP